MSPFSAPWPLVAYLRGMKLRHTTKPHFASSPYETAKDYPRRVYCVGLHHAAASAPVSWWSQVNIGMNVPAPPETRLLRLNDVVEATTLSKSLIYALMRVGAFPEPVRLSENRIAWTTAAIRDWITQRSPDSPCGGDRE